jgi:hypothetical protein
MSAERTFTAAEVDAAVTELSKPDRLDHAQAVITHAAPGLQRILDAALDDGGYFGTAHEAQILLATAAEDPEARKAAIRTLITEEVRIGMLIGASVGFQLARELDRAEGQPTPQGD